MRFDLEQKGNFMGTIPAIIPARAGSKGIINKNIIDFCGKPLLAWSILQARHCKEISNVYVSTNGDEIADVARAYGAIVIPRPAALSSDTSSSEEALVHAVKELEGKEDLNTILFLQATSPVRRKFDIDGAIQEYCKGKYDSLFSMTVLEDWCIWRKEKNTLKSFSYDYLHRGRRQEREPLYLENGSIYIFSKHVLEQYGNRMGGTIGMYAMPMESRPCEKSPAGRRGQKAHAIPYLA